MTEWNHTKCTFWGRTPHKGSAHSLPIPSLGLGTERASAAGEAGSLAIFFLRPLSTHSMLREEEWCRVCVQGQREEESRDAEWAQGATSEVVSSRGDRRACGPLCSVSKPVTIAAWGARMQVRLAALKAQSVGAVPLSGELTLRTVQRHTKLSGWLGMLPCSNNECSGGGVIA